MQTFTDADIEVRARQLCYLNRKLMASDGLEQIEAMRAIARREFDAGDFEHWGAPDRKAQLQNALDQELAAGWATYDAKRVERLRKELHGLTADDAGAVRFAAE